MTKLLVFIIAFFTFSYHAAAQKVTNLKVYAVQDSIIFSFNIDGKVGPYQQILLKPYIEAGSKKDTSSIKTINGDVALDTIKEERKEITDRKQIIWEVSKDLPDTTSFFQKGMTYGLELEIKDLQTPFMWTIAYSGTTSAPYGFSILGLSKWGGYLSADFYNLQRGSNGDITSEGLIGGDEETLYTISQKSSVKSYSVTGGITKSWGLSKYLYLGAGYGLKELVWQVKYDEESNKPRESRVNVDQEYRGLVLEGGIFWRIGKGNWMVETGLGSILGKTLQGNFGVGYRLGNSQKNKRNIIK